MAFTDAQRLQVKLFIDGGEVDTGAFIPVFHEWIKQGTLEDELLIDVADYSHVHRGPGVCLIGHGSDYSIDLGQGGPGLLYFRKRDAEGDAGQRLSDAFRRALRACQHLERSGAEQPVRFRTDRIMFRIVDRLNAPNTDQTFDDVMPELSKIATMLFAGDAFTATRTGADNEPFTVELATESRGDVETLLSRLAAS